MSVLEPPPRREPASASTLPSYATVVGQGGPLTPEKSGISYPPTIAPRQLAGKRSSGPSKLSRLYSTVSMASLIGALVVLIGCVVPSSSLIDYLGVDDASDSDDPDDEAWLPCATFWTNEIPLPDGFVRDQIAPPQSALIALGILHVLMITATFGLLCARCLMFVGHAQCLHTYRRAAITVRAIDGIFWTSLIGVAICWAADYAIARQASNTSDDGIVLALLRGGSVPASIPYAFVCVVVCGISILLERRHEILGSIVREAHVASKCVSQGGRPDPEANMEPNANVGAPRDIVPPVQFQAVQNKGGPDGTLPGHRKASQTIVQDIHSDREPPSHVLGMADEGPDDLDAFERQSNSRPSSRDALSLSAASIVNWSTAKGVTNRSAKPS